MLVPFNRDLQASFFSFKREDFYLEGLYLGERKFDLRDRLNVKALGGRLGGLWRRVDKRPLKMRGVFIEKPPSSP